MRTTFVVLAALLAAPSALAQAPTETLDKGSYILYLHDQSVGAETFVIEARADSINATSHSYRKSRTSSGETMVEKAMVLSMDRSDYALRYYQANETYEGETLIKGVIASGEDTAFTIFRERKGGGGDASRLVAPPGRMFVLDSGLYALFNLICLNLYDKTFASRPITLLTLSTSQDTVVEAEVVDLGQEVVRWAAKPVTTRKLQFKQGDTEFVAWIDPAGRMLRLTHEASGLRVERDAPPVKKRATKKPGG
jgi:hypothetical protein